MPDFTSDRALYTTAPVADESAEVVEEGDERAAFLLVGEGGTVPAELAERFKLKATLKGEHAAKADKPAEAEAEAPADTSAPEGGTKPTATKAQRPSEDKGA